MTLSISHYNQKFTLKPEYKFTKLRKSERKWVPPFILDVFVKLLVKNGFASMTLSLVCYINHCLISDQNKKIIKISYLYEFIQFIKINWTFPSKQLIWELLNK